MNKLNIQPDLVPPAHNVVSVPTSPAEVIANRVPMAQNAATSGLTNILGGLSPLLPIAGIGFLTWLGADMILGGALGNPLTPQGAKRTAIA